MDEALKALSRAEIREYLEALRADYQAMHKEIRAIAAYLERTKPHSIIVSGIPSAEKFGNIGGKA